jgi:hypothetical protein
MSRLFRHYLGYRRVGIRRLDAFRFAWLVVGAGVKPAPLRHLARR